MRRTRTILGATGSIGRSSIAVALAYRKEIRVEAVVGGRDAEALAWGARTLGTSFAALAFTAGLALPDMKVPIASALRHHGRLAMALPRLDLAAIGRLSFEAADEARFPCLALARAALRTGGAMPTILNAANEIAVAAFLAGQIDFYAISEKVELVCSTFSGRRMATPATISEALAIDEEAREAARQFMPG